MIEFFDYLLRTAVFAVLLCIAIAVAFVIIGVVEAVKIGACLALLLLIPVGIFVIALCVIGCVHAVEHVILW